MTIITIITIIATTTTSSPEQFGFTTAGGRPADVFGLSAESTHRDPARVDHIGFTTAGGRPADVFGWRAGGRPAELLASTTGGGRRPDLDLHRMDT
jgi:hypothetical protein